MARLPRIVVPGQPLHVIQRGNNRQAIFYAEKDYLKFLNVLACSADTHGCHIHAYVLMTNHVHLLLTPDRESSLSVMMQALGRQYVRYVNKLYRRTGTLWEGRFRSALIDSEQYLLICSRYIELNPVRASIVQAPREYRWSSFRANAHGFGDMSVTPHELYMSLGETAEMRQVAYRALFQSHVDAKSLQLIREGTQRNTIIGDNRFQGQIQAMLERRVVKQRHGGDRKSRRFKLNSSNLTP